MKIIININNYLRLIKNYLYFKQKEFAFFHFYLYLFIKKNFFSFGDTED